MKLRVMTCFLKYVKNLKNTNEASKLINCVVRITNILENNKKLIGFSFVCQMGIVTVSTVVDSVKVNFVYKFRATEYICNHRGNTSYKQILII